MGLRSAEFLKLADEAHLSYWQDAAGLTYWSLDEVDELARELGIPVQDIPAQLELDLGVQQ
jgi:hypothetical protein